MGRVRITGSKQTSLTEAKKNWRESPKGASKYSCDFVFGMFLIAKRGANLSKETLSHYSRCYKKFGVFMREQFETTPEETPITFIQSEFVQPLYVAWLQSYGLKIYTVNSYLRGFRAWGNFAVEEGYIEYFKCPIKEVPPPIKEVYTNKELDKLMVKPSTSDFTAFRSYCIISLILNTGARSNTILNIHIEDVNLQEGYINFNTTKSNAVVRLPLERKTLRDIHEWIDIWRYDKGATPSDFLFCNEYGEQLARSSLCKSIALYNKSRGVEKTSIHLFRHTFAKNWITSGGDIITLAQVLTHKELEMVKIYSNLYSSDIKREVEIHSTIAQMKQNSGNTLKTRRKLSDR